MNVYLPVSLVKSRNNMLKKRLQQLENNITQLQKIRNSWTLKQIKGDKTREWSLRYGLLESIQIVIDIACHFVVEKNLGNAETYSDCFKLLKENDYLTVEMEEKLTGMAGMRNVLVHEYVAVELQQLYDALDHLEDFTEFAKMVRKEFN